MGLTLSSILTRFFGKKQLKLLMIGLDCAGKTTILYKLKLGEIITTIPTIGFNVESVEYKNISFVVWDIGGQSKIRPLWHHYYNGTEGIIFVIDSNDRERLKSAAEELNYIMSEAELKTAAILIIANKQDLPQAMGTDEIIEELGIRQTGHKNWLVQGACATQGYGLFEGLDWLSNAISRK